MKTIESYPRMISLDTADNRFNFLKTETSLLPIKPSNFKAIPSPDFRAFLFGTV